MKFERTDRFKVDYGQLPAPEREMFRAAVRAMNQAAGAEQDPRRVAWPATLRIKAVANAPGVWEMTWSFAGPDGRATFEFVRVDATLGVRWRRVGGHSVLRQP